MSETVKACGNCRWFSDEDMEGYGFCGTRGLTKNSGFHCPMWEEAGKIDRIENAINHIKTAVDVYSWAAEIAVEAMQKQIPQKPGETVDHTWGIEKTQKVCPVCNCYLGRIEFIGDGRKVAYCETCGQAIDWEDNADE